MSAICSTVKLILQKLVLIIPSAFAQGTTTLFSTEYTSFEIFVPQAVTSVNSIKNTFHV